MNIQRLLYFTIFAFPAAGFAEHEKSIAIDKLPESVAAAIRAAGGENAVVKPDKEGDLPTFEAQWNKDGFKRELTVSPDGTILSDEQTISFDSAPAAVQAAIKAAVGEGSIEEVKKETAKGVVSYEAQIETREGDLEIKFDTAGKEISREVEKEHDDDDKDDGKGAEKREE